MSIQYRSSDHYDAAPQIFPEVKGDRLSSLECRTFRKFVSLFAKGMDVVDLGCGTGRVGRYLSHLVKPRTHIALELSSEELILARKLGSGGDGHFLIRADMLHLPLKRVKYCVCHGVVHHTPDPGLAMKEIALVMEKGGYIYLAIYSKSWYRFLYKFFAVFRKLREKRLEPLVDIAYYIFFIPRYLLRVIETGSIRRDFNIRASFEDFVMTPCAHFFSDKDLEGIFDSLGLMTIDHELINYGLLHCYILRKA